MHGVAEAGGYARFQVAGAEAFMDQIDTFVVLRHGRLRGLGRRYVHSWFVPMKQ